MATAEAGAEGRGPNTDASAAGHEPNTDALIGKTVGGRFHITDRIARGGMACVYFATQQPLNRPAAIKVMRADGGAENQESFRRRFIREASMLSQLQHPNIVTLLDYGQISELPGAHYFMAMEYLHGETLGKRLRSRGPLTVIETLRLARQIGRGLREAHRRGFVHRDLKPSNIMLVPEDDQNDIVKLVDFGIGKVVAQPNPDPTPSDEEDMTRMGLLLGSPRHMSPEQIRGDAIEPRTDLYGLGVVLFQALSGHLPFDGRTEVDILVAHCSTPAPKLRETYPNRFVPESLSNLIDSLLRKQVSARPTIYEFLLKLADVEDEVYGAYGMAGPTSSIPPLKRTWMSIPPLPPATEFGSEHRTVSSEKPVPELSAFLAPRDAAPDSGSFVTPLTLAPKRSKRLGIGLVLLLFCAGVGLILLLWRPHSTLTVPASNASNASNTSRSASLSAPPVAVKAPAVTAPLTFVLNIDSTPSGAAVAEDGLKLGQTPLKLAVDHSAVARAPRHFSVERDGFVSYRFDQGDSLTDVAIVAKLKPKPPTPVITVPAAARAAAARTEAVKFPSAAATAYAVKGDDSLEIRTRR